MSLQVKILAVSDIVAACTTPRLSNLEQTPQGTRCHGPAARLQSLADSMEDHAATRKQDTSANLFLISVVSITVRASIFDSRK